MPLLLMSLLAVTIAGMSDLEHMSKCLPAVRFFVSEGGDSVDWLFEKANNDADVVLLYMMRMCYFHQDRNNPNQYDTGEIFARVSGHVPSFSEQELTILGEAVSREVISGKPYDELFNKDSGFFSGSHKTATFLVLFVLLSFFVVRRNSNRIIQYERVKQE